MLLPGRANGRDRRAAAGSRRVEGGHAIDPLMTLLAGLAVLPGPALLAWERIPGGLAAELVVLEVEHKFPLVVFLTLAVDQDAGSFVLAGDARESDAAVGNRAVERSVRDAGGGARLRHDVVDEVDSLMGRDTGLAAALHYPGGTGRIDAGELSGKGWNDAHAAVLRIDRLAGLAIDRDRLAVRADLELLLAGIERQTVITDCQTIDDLPVGADHLAVRIGLRAGKLWIEIRIDLHLTLLADALLANSRIARLSGLQGHAIGLQAALLKSGGDRIRIVRVVLRIAVRIHAGPAGQSAVAGALRYGGVDCGRRVGVGITGGAGPSAASS